MEHTANLTGKVSRLVKDITRGGDARILMVLAFFKLKCLTFVAYSITVHLSDVARVGPSWSRPYQPTASYAHPHNSYMAHEHAMTENVVSRVHGGF